MKSLENRSSQTGSAVSDESSSVLVLSTSLLESLLLPFPCDVQAVGDDPYGLALATSLPPPACLTSQLIHRSASLASAHVLFTSFLGTVGGGGQRTRIRPRGVKEVRQEKMSLSAEHPQASLSTTPTSNVYFSSVCDRRAGWCLAHHVIIGDWFRTERSTEKWGVVTLSTQGGLFEESGFWGLQRQGILARQKVVRIPFLLFLLRS